MKVKDNLRDSLTIFLHVSHPDVEEDPVTVEIVCDNKLLGEEIFNDRGWRKVVLNREGFKDSNILTFQVSRTWNHYAVGFSDDPRDLGVAIAVPEYNQ